MSINKAKSIKEVISKLSYIKNKLDKKESAEDFALSMMIADCLDYLRDIENPWNTGTPTEDGWYLAQATYGYYLILEINTSGKFMVDVFGGRTELTKEDIECVVAYQKI